MIEALIGLGLVGLVISYLPTIYTAYLDREIAVARLEVRAGRPAHPVTFLHRSNRIGWLQEMDPVWAEWENWFLEIEETHSTHTSLVVLSVSAIRPIMAADRGRRARRSGAYAVHDRC